MAKGIEELKKDLAENQELYAKYNDILKKHIEEQKCENDGELIISAAKELGYDVTHEEIDRDIASLQELDLDEMTLVSGGKSECDFNWKTVGEDEKGHNGMCYTLWHCYLITCHTETNSKTVNCFKDYKCENLYHDDIA